jgi:hypothetical protein
MALNFGMIEKMVQEVAEAALIPVLVKAIQELSAENVETLRITAIGSNRRIEKWQLVDRSTNSSNR